MDGPKTPGSTDGKPDMAEVLARVAEIRLKAEADRPRFPARLVGLVVFLLILGLLPLLMTGPCQSGGVVP
jgi:hypothetical protein